MICRLVLHGCLLRTSVHHLLNRSYPLSVGCIAKHCWILGIWWIAQGPISGQSPGPGIRGIGITYRAAGRRLRPGRRFAVRVTERRPSRSSMMRSPVGLLGSCVAMTIASRRRGVLRSRPHRAQHQTACWLVGQQQGRVVHENTTATRCMSPPSRLAGGRRCGRRGRRALNPRTRAGCARASMGRPVLRDGERREQVKSWKMKPM